MSLFPARMSRLSAIILDSDLDTVTTELLRRGVLHFVTISHAEEDWGSRLDSVKPGAAEARIAETRKRIESFLALAGRRPGPPEEASLAGLAPLHLEQANATLDELAAELQQIRERQRAAQQEILKLEEVRRQVAAFGDFGHGLPSVKGHTFLSVMIGSVTAVQLAAFSVAVSSFPSVLLRLGGTDRRTSCLLLCMKRDQPAVGTVLQQFGWEEAELGPAEHMEPAGGDLLGGIDSRLETLRSEQRQLGESVPRLAADRAQALEGMWSQARMNELYARIQNYFARTARTVVFSGWVPADQQPELDSALRAVTGERCYIEWSPARALAPAEQGSIPVKLANPRLLSPFQKLVENFSIPQYGTVDPTLLVAVAYLMMFGLMFGDVGYGAVVLLVGILGLARNRRLGKPPGLLMPLLCWCGPSAMVAGALFGSYFGRPWLPPLWFNYHAAVVGEASSGLVRDINGVLTITIYFGIAVIGVGLLLNWVNLARRRQWTRLFLDKGGVLGGWMYGAGVWAVGSFARSGFTALPPTNLLGILFGIPALLFIAKPLLEFGLGEGAHGRQRKPFGPMTIVDFLMEWIVQMLEIFSGYLANTLSFMRVAGLGIGHVSLVLAFTQIADLLGSGGSWGIGSYATYVAGSALIIGLEGLSAGIQSLRLNYYEFFTKYFIGGGKVYMPVSLRLKTD